MERFTVGKTEKRCERDELIDLFLSRLNPSRIESGYPPLTASRLSRDIKKAKGSADTTTLRDLYKLCDQANHFSRFFWGVLKQCQKRAEIGKKLC